MIGGLFLLAASLTLVGFAGANLRNCVTKGTTTAYFHSYSRVEKRYAARECQSLMLTVPQRCFGGDVTTGKYVGDLKCWPFSKLQRMRGVWSIAMEASLFVPNAERVTSAAPPHLAWLETNLSRTPENDCRWFEELNPGLT